MRRESIGFGLALLLWAVFGEKSAQAAPPANFQNEVFIASGLAFPTALEFLPDGRMLIAQFAGRVVIVQAGATVFDATPVLQLVNVINENVTGGGERGLVNVLADPNFASNGYLYLFYTAGSPQRDRVSRFTLAGNTASLASEVVIWQGVANSTSTDHHGGGMVFGLDGKLYISTGDNGDPPSCQALNSDHGKLLRINPDGTVPTDNPFFDGAGPNIDAIWARGLRNPFRISLDAPTGKIYIGDVGQFTIEEVNVAARGANFGWPVCEGPCGTAGMTNPIFSWNRSGRDGASMGGFVYRGSQFPTSYQGVFFYADYAQNWIRYLTLNAQGNVTGSVNFEPANGTLDSPSVGDPVMLKVGPEGALYYIDVGLSWSGGGVGGQHSPSIRRIRYTAANQPPEVNVSATPVSGPAPLSVNFSSAGSFDPEGQGLSYLWTFGDGTTSTQANPTHVYQQNGVSTARLALSDSVNTTQSGVLIISVGNAPTGTITSPASGLTFRAGDVIGFSGTAIDLENGILPASAYSWTILFYHDTHVHPALGPLVGVTSGTFAIPTSGHDFSGNTRYEIILTVTDSDGLQHSSSVFINPEKVNLSFNSVPAGLSLSIDGIGQSAPFTKDALVGFQYTVTAPNQTQGPNQCNFLSWSDGGAQSHTITVPATAGTYTANFQVISNPLPAGLVLGYGFNEGSGTTLQDVSGNGNAATISGATWTTAGKYGSALSFDGVNDWVTVADSASLDLTTGMTLEVWVYPTALGSGVWRNVMIKERAGGEVYNLYAKVNTSVPAIYIVRSGGIPDELRGTGAVPLNAWTHLAATYDNATLRLFVDGTQVASRALSGAMMTSTGALRIGGNSLWGEYFQGRIDEVRIYNRALTQSEVQADMNSPIGSGAPNTAPTISTIANQATNEDTSTAAIPFTVGDAETPAGSLTVSGNSSSTGLVPTSGIVFGGSGANRTVTVTPATNQIGSATITVVVSDGSLTASNAFVVTVNAVNDRPTISTISNQSTTMNTATAAIPFTVGDVETAAGSLTLSGSSTNLTLVPNSSIVFGGSGASRTVTVTPASGQTGTTMIRITVGDGSLTASNAFTLTVNAASSGLVAAYSFDAGSGTTLQDVSGSANNGTISGATWTTAGKYGSALSFDGINDWVTVSDSASLDLTTGMTLEAWVYPTTTSGVREVLIKEGANVDIYNLYARNWRGLPEGNAYVGGSNRTAEGLALPANTWTHLAATYDGTAVKLFVNGAQVASTAISGTIATSTGALRMGGNSLWGEYFQGRIDEVRIYNRALTQSEVQTDINTSVGGSPAPTAVVISSKLKITVAGINAAGSVTLQIEGKTGETLMLEASQDLIYWTHVAALENVDRSLEFTDATETGQTRRFYCTVSVPKLIRNQQRASEIPITKSLLIRPQIVVEWSYLSDPDQVELIPGVTKRLRLLSQSGPGC